MKNLMPALQIMLIALFCPAFIFPTPDPAPFLHTKWISPVSENCHASLCFTSGETVMMYECRHDMYAEIGYTIKGDTIEIEAFQHADMRETGKLILIHDDGILRQPSDRTNSFPRHFVQVPGSTCQY